LISLFIIFLIASNGITLSSLSSLINYNFELCLKK